jgi:hypothetical protein
MPCSVCGQRKERRDCPALRTKICTICCGTKRLSEIQCPSDCVHLASARQHPPAVTVRQQERDVAALLPAIRHLNQRQKELLYLFFITILGHVPEGLVRLHDSDVADAAEAVAKTLETAAKGVIYEHAASSQHGQKLARALTDAIAGVREQGATVYDGEAAIALRALEASAREVDARTGGGETAFLDLVRRIIPTQPAATVRKSEESGLILP